MRTKSLLAASLFAASAFATVAGPAQAAPIKSVNPPMEVQIDAVRCNDTSGYVMIHNQGRHCFANGGRMDVYITDVYKVDSGNNLITIDARDWRGNPIAFQMNKFQTREFNPRIVVEDVTIH
ncbi:beta/gamma crystallin domain-containing protein [Actinokineospora sp. 24-640]